MQHVCQPLLVELQKHIQGDVLDVIDVWRTLNPYWALYVFTQGEPENEEYQEKMFERMDALRDTGENRPVLYIESIYVREDCRRNGICRMLIDLLRMYVQDDPVIWLNMEPTSGDELNHEYDYFPTYTICELGQININASIAEDLGFTIDADPWKRQAEKLDDDGNIVIDMIMIRKCAYYLPKEIREIIKDDGDLVALGRAKQKIQADKGDDKSKDYPIKFVRNSDTADLWNKTRDGWHICEMTIFDDEEVRRFCFAARKADDPNV